MNFNFKDIINFIKNSGYWVLMSCITFALISFTNSKQEDRVCDNLDIVVKNEYQNYFIDKDDVESLMTEGNRKIIKGINHRALDLRYYENLILDHNFVRSATVNRKLDGSLEVAVSQRKPNARVFDKNKSAYVDIDGNVLPLSKKYTARVLVVDNKLTTNVIDSSFFQEKEGEDYLKLINFIQKDEFWSKQIASMEIQKNGKVKMLMQVGKQYVEFGPPINIDDKFVKLKFFLKKIMPSKGWNTYERVNLEYKNQIVCE